MDENCHPVGTSDDATAEFSLVEFFRFGLAYPQADQFEAFVKPSFLDGLRELWAELLGSEPWPGVECPATLDDLRADYIALFDAGVPGPACPLLESHYLKNTRPPSVLLENKLFYSHFGFEHQSGKEAPDHLLVQLEFVAALDYLVRESESDATREGAGRARGEFIERHMLDWLPDAIAAMKKLPATVYFPLLRLLEASLRL